MSTAPTLAALRRTRKQQQTVLRWLRPVGPLLICFWVWVSWHVYPGPGLSGRGLVVSVAFGGFLVGALGAHPALRRSDRVPAAFLAVLLVSSAALLWAQPGGAGTVGVVACVLLVARQLPRRLGLALVVATFAGLAALAITDRHSTGPWGLVGVVAFGGFYGMTWLANQLGEANGQAEKLLTELEHTRAAEARAAGLAERQRLAREMHDVLAHSLSGMVLQLEAARMLAAADTSDPRLPEAIERAHHLGNAGLAEASRAIGMLRDEELPGPERLADLAARFQADRGIPCELTVSGPERPLTSEARLAVYRVAQEALTNIAKHARPERVRVCLAYEPGGTRLTVEDFGELTVGAPDAGPGSAPDAGPGSAPDAADADAAGAGGTANRARLAGGGYGLTGMRERAELLGGDLVAAATDSGFRVELRVPA